jgi:hypothetical protein
MIDVENTSNKGPTVTKQYDLENIAFNQCSWFCVEILIALKKNGWTIDEKNLVTMYNEALYKASMKRKQYGTLSWGESLFSKNIHANNNYELYIATIKRCIVNENMEKNLIYIESMHDINQYKDRLELISFQEMCKNIDYLYGDKKFIMINRYGESFVIFPKDMHHYYIFDSHKSEIKIMNKSNVIQYIIPNDTYNQIIYVDGFQTNMCMPSDTINKLYQSTDQLIIGTSG